LYKLFRYNTLRSRTATSSLQRFHRAVAQCWIHTPARWQELLQAVTSWCRLRVRSRDVADVASEITMRAMATLPDPQHFDDLRRWALGIGRRVVAEYWRVSGAMVPLVGDVVGRAGDAGSTVVVDQSQIQSLRDLVPDGGGASRMRTSTCSSS
jgi:hypothetical protein